MITTISGCLSKMTEYGVTNVLMLFSVIVLSVAQLFRQLNLSLLQLTGTPSSKFSIELLSIYLEQWRRHHVLVCQLVDEMKSFFGVILLVSLAHSFVSLITDSFEISMAVRTSNWFLVFIFVSRVSINLLRFSTVCFGCWFLESEVGLLTIVFLRFKT